jgi:hypothetical protein
MLTRKLSVKKQKSRHEVGQGLKSSFCASVAQG